MAIFGRGTARQRLRRASQQALSVPTFRTSTDCTPWIIGGLWPAELSAGTGEIATLAEYLRVDLQRIANSANDKLRVLNESGLQGPARQAEEHRVISVARAFAVLRVESTVRHLRKEASGFQSEYLSLTQAPVATTPAVPQPPASETAQPEPAEPDKVDPDGGEPEVIESVAEPMTVEPEPEPAPPPPVAESGEQRLHRLLGFVARQEPGLRWAVGDLADSATVLLTDLAHGWIPPGIQLPADVELLAPARRSGKVAALIGAVAASATVITYTPGDAFGAAAERDITVPSSQPLQLPEVDDLGWKLGEATHWRDGLPRMVHTLAKAAAAGTGVVEAEIDVLRLHLDTARYQLVAQYPDVDLALLLNCQLLAATDGLASGDKVAANYHFSWYEVLNARQVSQWGSS